MSYVGNTPTTQSFISGTDYFNGTGAQTAFTLSRTVASVNDIQAVVNNVVQVPNDAYTISGTTITFTSAPSAGTQNVYVRYLSTTTQAITPSQGTVSWNTLDSNTQQDLGLMGKNKIINGNMVIAQRGTGSIAVDNGAWYYPVDRFSAYHSMSSGSKFSVQQNAGSVTPPIGFNYYIGATVTSAYSVTGSDWAVIRQTVEGFNWADLLFGTANAKNFTASFWVRSSLTGTFGGAFYNNDGSRSYPYTYTINTANTWEYKTITVVGDTSGTWNSTNNGGITIEWSMGTGSTLSGPAGAWASAFYASATGATNILATNGATLYITGVQLEVGTQATAFSTAGGSYGAELALCQRYALVLGGSSFENIGLGVVTSSTNVNMPIILPVDMRASPSVSFSGTIYMNTSGLQTVTAMATNNASVRMPNFTITSSGMTTGTFLLLSANGKMTLSAEL